MKEIFLHMFVFRYTLLIIYTLERGTIVCGGPQPIIIFLVNFKPLCCVLETVERCARATLYLLYSYFGVFFLLGLGRMRRHTTQSHNLNIIFVFFV